MSQLVPEYGGVTVHGMHVSNPGVPTQVGCVWCLKENIESPSTFDIIYYYSGTSSCGRHLKMMFDSQGATSATTTPSA